MPDFTLYHLPGSMSTAPHWLLLDLARTQNVTFDTVIVDVHAGAQFDPAFLAINPKGKIPALVAHNDPTSPGVVVTEAPAIMYYLASRFAPHLIPAASAPAADVARFNEALAFFASTLSADIRNWFFAGEEGERLVPGWSGADANTVRRLTRPRLEKDYAFLDGVLAERKFVAGDSLSIVDYLVVAATSLSTGLLSFAGKHAHVKALIDSLHSSDGWKELVVKDKFAPGSGDEAWGL
ncbi:Glutathione S-transferase 1-1 [Vanrija pseudolonga]|uniref:Glutathione S-transferase 1-1 n=1 Tax=Vanrija pseudolonga TaxID=143232 RepID=A0AAF0YEY0_9TREE|nr:Glutathione S-transferase 1-1 [Vanrija pseudolonga]